MYVNQRRSTEGKTDSFISSPDMKKFKKGGNIYLFKFLWEKKRHPLPFIHISAPHNFLLKSSLSQDHLHLSPHTQLENRSSF